MGAEYGSLPFDLAILFFREKLSMPTETWTELWKAQHDAAFTVAGAMEEALLTDLREAVDKAIAEGITLREFRAAFDEAVKTHGWVHNGAAAWRARLIWETNIRTAYAAGRYAQMTDPDVLRDRPFWMYRHYDSRHPRLHHKAWDGLILRADDPWWKTHYPPNGWGCKCRCFSLSHRDLERMGREGPDTAPDEGTFEWTDPRTGERHTIPNGIDPGWDYTPGTTRRLAA